MKFYAGTTEVLVNVFTLYAFHTAVQITTGQARPEFTVSDRVP